MKRNLGDMAENELRRWASQVGITANPANLDREGWDFVLQFPFSELEEDIPLDRRDSRIECWVQVKGRETTKNRKSIKLSNWEKLIRTPLPVFFLVFDFGKEDDPRNAYLVHVGEKWINKVLRKLRKLRSDDATKIHKKTLDLTWDEKDRISPLDGKGLSKAIQKHIPDGMEKYAQRKLEIRKTAGVPIPALMHITTTFENEEEYWTQWVDFIIGIQEEMPTSQVILEKDIRFGLPAEQTTYDGKGVFKFKSNDPIECVMVFKNEAGTLQAQRPARFYTPRGFFPDFSIPERYIKFRIEFDLGEFVIRSNSGRATGTFNFAKVGKLQSFVEQMNIWRMAEILNLSQKEDCTIELWREGEKLFGPATIAVDSSSFDSAILEIIQTVEDAWFLAKMLEVSPDTEINLDQLLAQRDALRFLRQICDVNISIDSFSFHIGVEEPPEKEVAVPFIRKIFLGNQAHVVSVGVAGQPILTLNDENNSYTVQIKNLRRVHLEHFIVQKGAILLKDEIMDNLSAKLEDKGFDVVIMG